MSYIQYKDKSGEDKIQQITEAFLEIMINVLGTKELYEALENMYYSTIDDYSTPEVSL